MIGGLTAETEFITDNSKDPGIAYVKNPVINCQSELSLARKKEQKQFAKQNELKLEKFVTMPVRYVERENFLIAEANDLAREKSPSDGVIRTQQELL